MPNSTTTDALASLADLRPYGSLIICEIKGEKPDLALTAAVDAIQKRLASRSSNTGLRRSALTTIGPGLSVISLEWHETRPASGFTDGRVNRRHGFIVVASDGHYIALSTNLKTAASQFVRWIASAKQGYDRRISDSAFRSIAANQPAVAAWLRNTAPDRSTQFTAVAITGQNLGASATASDLSSYLANTVRVEHPVDDRRTEGVTVNPGLSKLTFKQADRVESWAELVEIAFVWLHASRSATARMAMLAGTADIVQSLDGVGAPYDMMLPIGAPDLPRDDLDDDLAVLQRPRFAVQ